MQLNHLHICVQDVAAVSSFFVTHFGFNLRETKGRNGLAVVTDGKGFVLALMRLPSEVMPEQAYPPMFHVGFLVADGALLDSTHGSLVAAGCDPSAIEHMRGARRFYCKAPGGLLVEVGHEPDA